MRVFHLSIFDRRTGRTIYTNEACYDARYGTDLLVLWHPSLPILAVSVPGGRRYGHTELYSIKTGKVEKLSAPNYQQNALQKVNAVRSFNVMFDHFERWQKNDLRLELQYNACKPSAKKGYRTQEDYAGSYIAKVVLRVQHPKTLPRVVLQSLSVKPD